MAEENARVTPASVFKQEDNVEAARYRRDIIRARAEGVAEGRTKARKEVVDWLQRQYVDVERAPERGSEGATAILQLTRDLMGYLMEKTQ